MERHSKKRQNHFIICGFGRVGEQVAREFTRHNREFVILERDTDRLNLAKTSGWPFMMGDVAIDESLLEKADIGSAAGMVIAVGNDADAIFIAISARALREDIVIVARASNLATREKLAKIGVNRVTLPHEIGGHHLASLAIESPRADLLDILVNLAGQELPMREVAVQAGGQYDGLSLAESGLGVDGVVVLVIRPQNGSALINPSGTTKLMGNDRLIILGRSREYRPTPGRL